MYDPIRWYLETIRWQVEVAQDAPRGIKQQLKEGLNPGLQTDSGTAWAELTIDCILATRVKLLTPGQSEVGILAEQVAIFTRTANRIAAMAGSSPTPCAPWKLVRSLRGLGYRYMNGVAGRAELRFPTEVKELLAQRQLNVKGFHAGEGHLNWKLKIQTLPPVKWQPTINEGVPSVVQTAAVREQLSGTDKQHYSKMLSKVREHNAAAKAGLHEIVVPAPEVVLAQMAKPSAEREFPPFSCKNCEQTMEWTRLRLFRVQPCTPGLQIGRIARKIITDVQRKITDHNKDADHRMGYRIAPVNQKLLGAGETW